MILILEDDVDRQRFQEHRSPFSPEFLPTVWLSPEAYAKEAILATLRAQVDELHAESMASPTGCPGPSGTGPCCDLGLVLHLIGGGQ